MKRIGNVLYLEPPPSRCELDQMLADVDVAISRDEARIAAYRASLRPQNAPMRSQHEGAWGVVLTTSVVLVLGAVAAWAFSIVMRSPG